MSYPRQGKSDGIRKKSVLTPGRLAPHTAAPVGTERPADDPMLGSRDGSQFLDHWQERDDREVLSDYPLRGREGRTFGASGPAKTIRVPQARETPRVRRQSAAVSYSRLKYEGVICGVVAVGALLFVVSTLWARLTIEIRPRIEDVALQDIAVIFDTSVAKVLVPQKVIPAEKLSFSRTFTKEFSATGKDIIAERARGKAHIINRFSSAPQTLVAGTRFVTDTGVLFRLQKSVIVPGAKIVQEKIVPQSIDVELIADAPGEQANIGGQTALTIPGFKGSPKYDGFSAVAPQGFSGGFQGSAAIVSKDDLKNAQEEVTKLVFDALKAEIGRKIPQGFYSVDALRTVEITKIAAPAAGTRADHFSVSADAAGRAMVFHEEDAVALVTSFALQDAKDQEAVEGSARLSYRTRSVNFDQGKAEIVVSGNLKTKAVVHEDELASLVAGKNKNSIREVLQKRHELAGFDLSFFPPWRSSAPSNAAHIRFRVE